MKNYLSQSDMKEILKDWDGSFQITKTGGHIAAIHVSQRFELDTLPNVNKIKKQLQSIYPFNYKTEVDISDGKYNFQYSIRITCNEMNAFIKNKEILNTTIKNLN